MANQQQTNAAIELLLNRVESNQAAGRLSDFILGIKERRRLPRDSFRSRGTFQEVCNSVRQAIADRHLSLSDIASFVDEVDENGAQHIFMFNAPSQEFVESTVGAIKDKFTERPSGLDLDWYADLPAKMHLHYEIRGEVVVLREIKKVEYWVIDRNESTETINKQVIVKVKKESRALNLLRIHVDTGLIEIRLARASSQVPHKLWESELKRFADRILPALDFKLLEPIPIWTGFSGQLANRDDTYLKTDEAHDTSTSQRISKIRQAGSDLRDNPDYNLDEDRFLRDKLNIYWIVVSETANEAVVHTIQQRVKFEGQDLGKIYIAQHATDNVIDHVLGTIRSYVTA